MAFSWDARRVYSVHVLYTQGIYTCTRVCMCSGLSLSCLFPDSRCRFSSIVLWGVAMHTSVEDTAGIVSL